MKKYYLLIREDDDEVLDWMPKLPTQDELNNIAKIFGCDVWVLCGEHTGLKASVSSPQKMKSD